MGRRGAHIRCRQERGHSNLPTRDISTRSNIARGWHWRSRSMAEGYTAIRLMSAMTTMATCHRQDREWPDNPRRHGLVRDQFAGQRPGRDPYQAGADADLCDCRAWSPPAAVEDALIWDTLRPYHYVRLQPAGDGQDWLIVGGEDHRSGTADDMEDRFARLEDWTRERFRTFGEVEYRWSGQVMEPVDFLPYSGRDGSDRIYVHSGDSGTWHHQWCRGCTQFHRALPQR